jgi:uncharacterized protein
MEISGSYTLYAPRAQVWAALLNPDELRQAIPGCERLESIEGASGDTFALRVALGLSAFTGTYEGTLRLMERREPERFRLALQGAGTGGPLQGYGGLMLEARGPSTTIVTYAGEVVLGDTVAGARLFVIRSAARVLINQFFSRLAGALGEGSDEAPTAPVEPDPATTDAWPTTGLPEARPLEITAQATPEARPLPASAPDIPGSAPSRRTRSAAAAPRSIRLTAPAALRRVARRTGLSDGSVESEQRVALGLLGVALGLSLTLATSLAVMLGGRRRGL